VHANGHAHERGIDDIARARQWLAEYDKALQATLESPPFVAVVDGPKSSRWLRSRLPPKRRMNVVYEPSAQVCVSVTRRLTGRQATVSDGWLALAEQVVAASVVAPGSCSDRFVDQAASRAALNLSAQAGQAGHVPLMLPSWLEFLESDDECRTLRRPQRPVNLIAAGARMEAGLGWWIGQALAALPPDPAASDVTGADSANPALFLSAVGTDEALAAPLRGLHEAMERHYPGFGARCMPR
jgi:hypothetical protein